MSSLKKSKIRMFIFSAPFLIYGAYALVMGSAENLKKTDFENMRRKHRVLKNTSPIFRSFIVRGSGLLLLCFPLFGLWNVYRYPLIIVQYDDLSGTSLFKYRGLKAPKYKNFEFYRGIVTYRKPYINFNPPLICTDTTRLEKLYLPSAFLLVGGKTSIKTFVQMFKKPPTS